MLFCPSITLYIYVFALNFTITLFLPIFGLLRTIYFIDCNFNSFIMDKHIELNWTVNKRRTHPHTKHSEKDNTEKFNTPHFLKQLPPYFINLSFFTGKI